MSNLPLSLNISNKDAFTTDNVMILSEFTEKTVRGIRAKESYIFSCAWLIECSKDPEDRDSKVLNDFAAALQIDGLSKVRKILNGICSEII